MALRQSKVKICGLTDAPAIEAALSAGADYLGFVFYEPSPRHLSYDEAAVLAGASDCPAKKVALTVDANDRRLNDIFKSLNPDLLQLHGEETPERVSHIKNRFGVPIIKAIKIASRDDLAKIDDYLTVADILLFDAKMAPDAKNALPGGNGISFDWDILDAAGLNGKFMLSGGLDADNVAEAVAHLHPEILDVSSGVERAPGKKDPELIRGFMAAVAKANQQEYAA